MKRLLVVYHTQTGHTEAMARAVARGARHPEVAGVEVELRRAVDAGLADLLRADAVAFGTPENFGQLSGGMKDFFDRTFYPAQGLVEGLACAVFISAGNDGRGALEALRRIVRGYPLREVREPIIARGGLDAAAISSAAGRPCEELGLARIFRDRVTHRKTPTFFGSGRQDPLNIGLHLRSTEGTTSGKIEDFLAYWM